MLGRDTGWRQGSLITNASAELLGLDEKVFASGDPVVVISHDCDLASQQERFVEVIVGKTVAALDPNFKKAKNPRRLHIGFASGEGMSCVELQFSQRLLVDKEMFSASAVMDENFSLSDDEKRVLKQWLAARYGRPAYPNSFEDRLKKNYSGRKTVEKRIAKILQSSSEHLVGLFFDLGEDRHRECENGDPYYLRIYVVYDATDGGAVARKSAESTAKELSTLFVSAYGEAHEAAEIALDSCTAVADTYMTLADLRRVDQWRLEHVSLQQEPVGSFLPADKVLS